MYVPIKKLDEALQVVYGEVYAPNMLDSDGDFMTAPEIQSMAHRFLKSNNLGNIDIMHDGVLTTSHVVESFIVTEVDGLYIPGAWVVAAHIPDAVIWGLILSGDLNGFSMEGAAVRKPATVTVDIPSYVEGTVLPVEGDESGHAHTYRIEFTPKGLFNGGVTSFSEGHQHLIKRSTITEASGGDAHVHRYSFLLELPEVED